MWYRCLVLWQSCCYVVINCLLWKTPSPFRTSTFYHCFSCAQGRRVCWSTSKLCCGEGSAPVWYSVPGRVTSSSQGQCRETIFHTRTCTYRLSRATEQSNVNAFWLVYKVMFPKILPMNFVPTKSFRNQVFYTQTSKINLHTMKLCFTSVYLLSMPHMIVLNLQNNLN